MSHYIHSIICKTEQIKTIANKLQNAKFANLRQDITLIPMTDELFDTITESADFKKDDIPTDKFTYANSSILGLLCEISIEVAIGYIETDYFGGTGTQTAILFEQGKVYGPYFTDDNLPDQKRAINRILEKLGVTKKDYYDEFAAVGLSDFRNNGGMIEKYGVG
jgi:hypothetical protein